jgi:hypothetical protein
LFIKQQIKGYKMGSDAVSSKKKSNKPILLAVCLAVIVVAAVVSVYYFGLPSQPSEEPQGRVVTNFSDGAWANYSLTIYNQNGTVVSMGNMMAYANSGTYEGADCWVYVENVTYTSSEDTAVTDTVTSYLNKSTFAALHQTEQITSDGVVTYDEAFDSGDEGFMDTLAIVRNMTVTATDKSVTVPAGTFSTTQRQGTLTYPSDPTTYDLTSWASTEVPTWGMVKYEFRVGGVLFSEYLLEAYGN